MNESNKEPKKQEVSIGRIMELSRAFQASRVFLTGYEMDVFSVLGDEEKTSYEVASAIGADRRGTNRLLNALCALDLLTKSAERYANTPVAAKYLVKGKPDYQFGLMHTVHLWDSWTTLTKAVRKGGTVVKRPVDESGREWVEAFIGAMHGRAKAEAPIVVGKIDLTGVSRVLDVGGGSGAFSMSFVRAKEDLKATVFDLPNVLPLTRRYIEEAGFSEKISTVPGNYHENELGTGFDLVFLSAIIHANSFDQNQELVHKAGRALNPGGRIVISDFIMEENRFQPMAGAFFALNMLTGTPGGDTFTELEIKGWMEKAGIHFTERIDLARGNGLMIGTKKPS
jgi:precorrin-6B methylase 2